MKVGIGKCRTQAVRRGIHSIVQFDLSNGKILKKSNNWITPLYHSQAYDHTRDGNGGRGGLIISEKIKFNKTL